MKRKSFKIDLTAEESIFTAIASKWKSNKSC